MRKFSALCWFFFSCFVQASGFYLGGCQQFSHSDANILALSAHSGFCETHGNEAGKPECLYLKKNSYAATHLTLHGLWPNLKTCGKNYGFCNGIQHQTNFCNYAPLELTDVTAQNLRISMPAYQYGSCLERHEWNKHGSCQDLNADQYFSLAMRLLNEFNSASAGQFISDNMGKTISRKELRDKLKESFGSQSGKKFFLGCRNSILVDVYIQLPAEIPVDEPLVQLIQQAGNYAYPSTCPKLIKLSGYAIKD